MQLTEAQFDGIRDLFPKPRGKVHGVAGAERYFLYVLHNVAAASSLTSFNFRV